jgi:eukaryotic-like serine/threonine-protein kinase
VKVRVFMLQGRLPARYRVIEEVGQGGMAVVYKAHDETLKREVAVKVLHAHLLAETESKTRLEREAQAVAKLHHDNIVQVFDYSGDGAMASYIVTEFIDGQTLKQFMTGRKPPAPEVAALVALEVGGALLHAHSLGIIHRDVKPENVMVRKDGILKLMDFGVAQIMDLERMTVTGQLLGSPAYMAPEILEGKSLDVRTDVFSVGIMLYQLSTGALPFTGRNPHEVLKRIAEGKFADPRTINRQVADRLAKIIAKALARRPDDRYPTVGELLTDLTAFVGDSGLESTREELRGYFCNPERYEKEIGPRMLAALVAKGKQERADGRTARALELWNRALSMDPSNREVLHELKRLETRQHLKRGSLVAASVGVLAVGAFVTLNRASGEDPARAKIPAKSQNVLTTVRSTPPVRNGPAVPRTDPALGKLSDRPAPPSSQRGGRGSDRKTAALPSPRAQMRTIRLAPFPPSAAIFVDGQKVGSYDVDRTTIDLDWSSDHELEFRNDCCYPVSRRVGPNSDPLPDNRLEIPFSGKAAILTVKSQPPFKGKVGVREVDGAEGQSRVIETYGDLEERIPITFDGDRDMKKSLQLTVVVDAADGKKKVLKTIDVSAGRNKDVVVKLDD